MRAWAILGSILCPSAFIFILYKRSGALTGLECFLVVLLGAFVSWIRTASVFNHQTIGKCLCSTVAVVIQANNIFLATFGN